MKNLPVEKRITDLTVAYMCLCALVQNQEFKTDDETFFREDVKYSLKLIGKEIFKEQK